MGDKTADLRPKIEEILRRYKVRYELRTTSEESVLYMVTTPKALRTDRVSNVIMELGAGRQGRGRVGREIERQGSEVTHVGSSIVQPEAGVVPVVRVIKLARKTIDVFIFRLDRDEIEKALAAAVAARRDRPRADRAHQPRR